MSHSKSRHIEIIMRIACLQFAPELGNVQGNISRADGLLQDAAPGLSILVLPEMAFSGSKLYQARPRMLMLNHP